MKICRDRTYTCGATLLDAKSMLRVLFVYTAVSEHKTAGNIPDIDNGVPAPSHILCVPAEKPVCISDCPQKPIPPYIFRRAYTKQVLPRGLLPRCAALCRKAADSVCFSETGFPRKRGIAYLRFFNGLPYYNTKAYVLSRENDKYFRKFVVWISHFFRNAACLFRPDMV